MDWLVKEVAGRLYWSGLGGTGAGVGADDIGRTDAEAKATPVSEKSIAA